MPVPLQLRPKGFFGQGSVFVGEPDGPGQSPARRLDINKDALVTQPSDGVETIPDIIDYAARTHGERFAMGWREVIDIHEEVKEVKKMVDGKEQVQKKTWKYFQLSDYKHINYIQLRDAISEAARALVHLGLKTGDVVDLFGETGVSWQIISHASTLVSVTTATAYDTLGEAGLTHSLNEPKCVGIYTNADLLPVVIKVLPRTPSVRFVFYDGEASSQVLEQLNNLNRDTPLQIYTVDQLREIGRSKDVSTLADRRPNKDTLVCIMYTSGSTGTPKGVCLTHQNLVSAVGAITRVFAPHISAGNRYMAYLPLAHVLEYAVELAAVYNGVTCGYGRSKTLTDASVRHCKGDIAAFKPTIMFGVPAVWETIRKGVTSKLQAGGWLAQTAFGLAMRTKKWTNGWIPGLDRAIDLLVLNKVKAAFGGELRLALNGGAAISEETQEFFSLAIAPLVQGYGLTETCGMCAFLPPEMISWQTFNSVGLPAPSIEIKLLDCPDMGYISSTRLEDNTNSNASRHSKAHLPQGEICLRGPSVTKGYFNRPDLNNDENIFTKDGWFRTGDIGQWNEDGTLTLVDRLKNLVKMQNGEYIAIERLESVYKSSQFVANICVYAPQNAQQPIAIIVPHEQNLRNALSKQGSQKPPSPSPVDPSVINGSSSSSNAHPKPTSEHASELAQLDSEHLCSDPSVRAMVLNDCNALAKKNGFARMEMLSAVLLSSEEWTPQNGFVTAAQKLNRSKIVDRFETDIKKIFEHQ